MISCAAQYAAIAFVGQDDGDLRVESATVDRIDDRLEGRPAGGTDDTNTQWC